MDEWRPIYCERFDGESVESHRRRSTRIIKIINDFRMGRYKGDQADEMERQLMELQNPILEDSY